MPAASLIRSLLWEFDAAPGLEYCALWSYPLESEPGGWALRGTAVTQYDGVPTEVRYRVICDGSWRTRRAHIGVVRGGEKRALRLEADGAGRWRSGDEELRAVEGCIDVDLGIGASTNTLPIRRFDLAVGEAVELDAAWVRFPDLAVERLPQRYTRRGEDRYLYESRDSGFAAELTVDDLGLVIDYPKWCRRSATFDGAIPESTR